MIDRTDRQFFAGTKLEEVIGRLGAGLAREGLVLVQTGPGSWQARGKLATYGLVPKLLLLASPSPHGFYLDARLSFDLEPSAVIVLLVAWVFCFPVALLLALLAYQDLSDRLRVLNAALWAPVAELVVPPNYPAPWPMPPE